MPSPLEQARQAEIRKLRMAGMNPDGTPIDDNDLGGGGGNGGGGGDDDNDDNDDNGGNGGDDDRGGGDRGGGAQTLEERLALMEQNYNALHNRVAPLQRQNEDFRDMWNNERRAREEAEERHRQEVEALQEQLENRNTDDINLADVLSEDEINDLDPKVLQSITKLIKTAAAKMAPKPVNLKSEVSRLLDEREAARVTQYRRGVLTDPKRGIHKLSELSYDPKFATWVSETGLESIVSSLMAARTTEEVDRHAKIIANRLGEWSKNKGRNDPPSDPHRSLSNHMRRRPQSRMNEDEVKQRLRDIKALSRSGNPEDRKRADQLLKDLENNT